MLSTATTAYTLLRVDAAKSSNMLCIRTSFCEVVMVKVHLLMQCKLNDKAHPHFEVSSLISKHKNAERAWKATSISTTNQWHVVGQRVVCWQQLDGTPSFPQFHSGSQCYADWHQVQILTPHPPVVGISLPARWRFGSSKEGCEHLWKMLADLHVYIPMFILLGIWQWRAQPRLFIWCNIWYV